MVFSTNQVRHLYVVKAYGDADTPSAVNGTLENTTKDGKITFKYKGIGGMTRTDVIDAKKITRVNYTASTVDSQKTKKRVANVTVSNDVNNGGIILGQDYILRVNITSGSGLPGEYSYIKHAAAHATSTVNTKAKLIAKLAVSLAKNLSRDAVEYIEVYVGSTKVTPTTDEGTLTGETLTIKGATPVWKRGTMACVPTMFDVYVGTVDFEKNEYVWGEVTYGVEEDTLPNGVMISDLEYFCMGERGDMYRNIGWPNVIPTEYLADPDTAYEIFDIYYYEDGGNEAVQKSEKVLTLACLTTVDEAAIKKIFTDLGVTVTTTPTVAES